MFPPRPAAPFVFISIAAVVAFSTLPAAAGGPLAPRPGTYIVDASGGGDFTDLQTALDTIADGSTLVVKGEWKDYWTFVRKSVTVVGLHLSASGNDNPVPDDAIIEVDAGPDARVTFYGLHITLGPNIDFNGTRGINVHSAGDVVLSDAKITCSYVYTSEGDGYDRDGDGVVVDSARSLFLIRSTIIGGSDGIMFFGCGSAEHGPRGGNALEVHSLTGALVVEDSVLIGGDGGTMEDDCVDCTTPRPIPGMPGSGIVNASVPAYISNSTVTAGNPGHGWKTNCEAWPGVPGDPGQDVTGERCDLQDALHCNDAILGQPLHLKGTGYAPDELVLLFFSTSIGPAFAMRQGTWLLDWPILLVGVETTDATGAFAVDATVPNDPDLEGKSLVLQAFARSLVSEPLIFVPWQPH